jgi:hypothetical protein
VVEAVAVVATGVTAGIAFASFAWCATRFVVARERMPECMKRRRFAAGVRTVVRFVRTGKSMVMTHLGYSRLCLKMCRKIYI